MGLYFIPQLQLENTRVVFEAAILMNMRGAKLYFWNVLKKLENN